MTTPVSRRYAPGDGTATLEAETRNSVRSRGRPAENARGGTAAGVARSAGPHAKGDIPRFGIRYPTVAPVDTCADAWSTRPARSRRGRRGADADANSSALF